jgi:hypothetical protein
MRDWRRIDALKLSKIRYDANKKIAPNSPVRKGFRVGFTRSATKAIAAPSGRDRETKSCPVWMLDS